MEPRAATEMKADVELLRQDEPSGRAEAIERLSAVGECAVEPLIGLLRAGGEPGGRAAMALARIGSAAVPALEAAAREREHETYALAALLRVRGREATDALRRLVAGGLVRRKRLRRRPWRVMTLRDKLQTAFFTITPIVLGIAALVVPSGRPGLASHVVFAMSLFAISMVAPLAFLFIARECRPPDVPSLALRAEPAMLDVLCVCALEGDWLARRRAVDILKELLPQLAASDDVHVGTAERHALTHLLRTGDADLALGVLHGLELFGDASAILPVELLSEGHGAGRDERVQRAAAHCLTGLRAKAEQKWQSLTLVRPSEPVGAPDVLLRPAGTADTNVDVLLRATGDRADDDD